MVEGRNRKSVFFSYAWEESHEGWVKDLALRLRSAGIDVKLDKWDVLPGDRLPQFMERSIREASFVLCVCTPRYKHRFDEREGGAGYEAHLMTGEALAQGNERKFIGLLREGDQSVALPSWLLGKRYLDFRGDPYKESAYDDLVVTLYGLSPQAPPVRPPGDTSDLLRPAAVARQESYGAFLNAAIKAMHLAKSRLLLRKKNNVASQIMLPDIERDLETQLNRANELVQTFVLHSSQRVKETAGPIAMWIGVLRLLSWMPEREEEFEKELKKITQEFIPQFVEAARNEGGLR